MTTIAEVRESLAGAVEVAGLRCLPYEGDQVNAPEAHVDRGPHDPRFVMGDNPVAVRVFVVRGYFGRTTDRGSQVAIDEFCEPSGSSSVKAAIEDGANWSADVDYASVTSISGVRVVEMADGLQYLAVEWTVEVCW